MYTKLAMQLYSVRDYMQDEQGVRETFKRLAEMGYTQAQTAGDFPGGVDSFAQSAKDAGVEIIGTHYNFPSDLNDLDEYIRVHKVLGTTNAGVGGGIGGGPKDVIDNYIVKANALAEKLAEHGMKFTYHHHSYEFAKVEGRLAIERLLDGLNPRNTSICADTYWMQYAGVSITDWLKKLEGRIDILHLKDMAVIPGKNDPYITEIGNGNIDFATVLKVAEDTGVKYVCVEQDYWPEGVTSLECAKKSADYFFNVLCR